MNRFAAAVIIFVFFWAIVGPVCVGLLTLFTLATGLVNDISSGSGLWTVQAGSLAGTFLGLFFAAQRIRTNIPWKLSILEKSAIFGCVYYVAQALWLLLVFSITGPKGASAVIKAVDFVVRFPSSIYKINPKNSLTLHYAGLLVTSIFWAVVFYLIVPYLKRNTGKDSPSKQSS